MKYLRLVSDMLDVIKNPSKDASAVIKSAETLLKQRQPEAFNDSQEILLETYDDGWHMVETPKDVLDCEDALLSFLLVELSSVEDCDTKREAAHRVGRILKQLEAVHEKLKA